jgi:mono/diheme cytochrome c family protein
MNSRWWWIPVVAFVFLLAATAVLAGCKSSAVNPAPTTVSGTQDGAALLQERCSVCHSTDRVTQAKKTKAEWDTTVTRMVGKGAQLSDAEKQILVDYLAANYGS